GMVAGEALGRDQVAVPGALLRDDVEAVADLHALDRIDAHQRRGQFTIELAVDRLAPARRHAVGNHGDPRADRIAGLAQRVHVGLQLGHLRRVRPEERVVLDRAPVETGRLHVADPGHESTHGDAVALPEPLLGDNRRGHAHGGLARRAAASAARVADAVLLPVAVVGMAGTELRGEVRVALGAPVGVADQQRARGAGGTALVPAGQDLDLVGLAPRRGVAALAGGAPLQVVGDLLRRDLQARGAAIDDAAD